MKTLSDSMNQVLDEWKTRYNVSKEARIPMFTQNDRGNLFFYGYPLFTDDDQNHHVLHRAESTPESIIFHLEGRNFVEIKFLWPEDKAPCLRSVCFGDEDNKEADFCFVEPIIN